MPEQDDNTPQQKIKRHRPLLWIFISIVIAIIVLGSIGVLSIHANANNTQQPAQQKSAQLAVITNSGSTNAPASTLTIYIDGSGKLAYQRNTCPICVKFNPHRFLDKTFPAGTFAVAQLATVLSQVKDVSTIPNRTCLKSVSFGSSTMITYNGKTSGDVSCLFLNDGQAFMTVKKLVMALFTKAVWGR